MRIGIYPGSFNPIHVGHLMIANYIAEFEQFDEIWFLITPQNPIKKNTEIIPQEWRLHFVEESIKGYDKFKTCTIEWEMPKPTYTITTLQKLKITYPQYQFELIIGSDNWALFHRWKDYQRILKNFKIIVFPRTGSNRTPINHPNVRLCKAPLLDISSTFVRSCITAGIDARFFLPRGVYEQIIENNIIPQENEISETANED